MRLRHISLLAVSRVADMTQRTSARGPARKEIRLRNLFARQAIPMVWDFAEANLFSHSGRRHPAVSSVTLAKCIDALPSAGTAHVATQADAAPARLRHWTRLNRSAILRQCWICGPVRLLLRMAAAIAWQTSTRTYWARCSPQRPTNLSPIHSAMTEREAEQVLRRGFTKSSGVSAKAHLDGYPITSSTHSSRQKPTMKEVMPQLDGRRCSKA